MMFWLNNAEVLSDLSRFSSSSFALSSSGEPGVHTEMFSNSETKFLAGPSAKPKTTGLPLDIYSYSFDGTAE